MRARERDRHRNFYYTLPRAGESLNAVRSQPEWYGRCWSLCAVKSSLLLARDNGVKRAIWAGRSIRVRTISVATPQVRRRGFQDCAVKGFGGRVRFPPGTRGEYLLLRPDVPATTLSSIFRWRTRWASASAAGGADGPRRLTTPEYGLRTELTRSINYELHARISAGNNRAMFAFLWIPQHSSSHVRRRGRGFASHVIGTSRERHNAATGVLSSFLIGALLIFAT